MPNDPRDSSSDLARARALSHRLRGAAPAAEEARPGEPAWVDFSALRVELRGPRLAPSQPPAPAPIPEAPPAPKAPTLPELPVLPTISEVGSAAFGGLLDWCVRALEARDASIIDAQGLVVAARGGLSPESVQDVSARLVVAFGQVERIDTAGLAPASLLLELPDAWLSGFRVTSGGGHTLFVALVTREPLGRDKRALVERAFASITGGF